jgi:phage terminase large subunit
MSSEDPMSQRFIAPFQKWLDRDGYYEDDLHLIVKINWQDNPWFPESLNSERLFDFKHKPRAEYDHIWEGAFNDAIDNAIIKPEWFDAAIDAHIKLKIKPRGLKVVGFDPSDLGGDPKGFAYRHGNVFLDVTENPTGDVNDGADWAIDKAQEYSADHFVWDADGMGIGLKRQILKSLPKCETAMFHGGEEPDNPDQIFEPFDEYDPKTRRSNWDTFRNKRAQYYWKLAKLFYNTYRAVDRGEMMNPDECISISSKCELTKLRAEICRIPQVHNSSGRRQVMSKPEMKKKHGISSPNMADAMMMSYAIQPKGKRKGPSPQPKIKVY